MKKHHSKKENQTEQLTSIPALEKKATYDERYAAGKLLRESSSSFKYKTFCKNFNIATIQMFSVSKISS